MFKRTLHENSTIDIRNIHANRAYNVVELFAGAGGLALGLEKAGFNEVGLVEIDQNACNTLRRNRPHWNVIEEDVVTVAERGIHTYLQENIEVDLLSGGYPCQAFSYAGKRLGLEDVRGTMFYYYAKILRDLKPKVFLAENVKGLVTHDNGRTLQSMIDVFTEIGYKVTWNVLRAIDYGVAQKRERIVIIGIRNDIDIEFIKSNIDKFVYKSEEINKDSIKLSNIDTIDNSFEIVYKRNEDNYNSTFTIDYDSYVETVKEN